MELVAMDMERSLFVGLLTFGALMAGRKAWGERGFPIVSTIVLLIFLAKLIFK